MAETIKGSYYIDTESEHKPIIQKRWFLTVDWCGKGKRGIFSNINGNAFSKDTKHTEDEMWEILGAFDLILNPESIELSEDELKEYHRFYPLAEYSNQYGIVQKD